MTSVPRRVAGLRGNRLTAVRPRLMPWGGDDGGRFYALQVSASTRSQFS